MGSSSATTCPWTTWSFSSTRYLRSRPETTWGATFTMWASTNTSSVMEWLRRYSIQLITGTNPTATSPTTTASARIRPGRNILRRPVGGPGAVADAAWVGAIGGVPGG